MQAWQARDLCVSIATSMVAASNCFSLFRMADQCTLPMLQGVCLAAGLADFSQVGCIPFLRMPRSCLSCQTSYMRKCDLLVCILLLI